MTSRTCSTSRIRWSGAPTEPHMNLEARQKPQPIGDLQRRIWVRPAPRDCPRWRLLEHPARKVADPSPRARKLGMGPDSRMLFGHLLIAPTALLVLACGPSIAPGH